MKTWLGISVLVLVSACGGNETEQQQKAASNPYAEEQQLIQDAKSVEDMLNKNAQEKKEAVSEATK